MKSDVHFGVELHSRRKTMRGFHIPIWRKMTAKIKKVKMPDLSLRVKIMLYIAALACAVLSIVSITCGGIFPPAAEYAVYTAAGVTLFLSCFYLAGSLVLLKQKIMGLARSNTLTARLTDDIEYRSVLSAVCGVCMNIVFALFNGIAGWMSRSAWFGTLSAYYLILGMMRAYWIFHNRNKVRNRENQRSSRAPQRNIWRYYGVLFLFLAVVLCGAVILLVNLEGGKTYPGWTIYAAAGYSFTKIILAAVHVIRARKKKEQSWIMIRDIGLVDASVSILTLQTAMFAAFSADDRKLTVMMNGITGATVSLLILVFGIIYLLNRYI